MSICLVRWYLIQSWLHKDLLLISFGLINQVTWKLLHKLSFLLLAICSWYYVSDLWYFKRLISRVHVQQFSYLFLYYLFASGSNAIEILEAFERTLEDDYPPENERFEHGEMLLYKVWFRCMIWYPCLLYLAAWWINVPLHEWQCCLFSFQVYKWFFPLVSVIVYSSVWDKFPTNCWNITYIFTTFKSSSFYLFIYLNGNTILLKSQPT